MGKKNEKEITYANANSQRGTRWGAWSYTNIKVLAHHPGKFPPSHAQVVRRGDALDFLARLGVEPGDEGISVRLDAVDLRGEELVADVARQTLLEGRLRPVNAKVPVACALVEAEVLLEDGAGNADLHNGRMIVRLSVCEVCREGVHRRGLGGFTN